MTGVVEETGQVAKATILALRHYPALLTLTILQIIMMGAVVWTVHQRNLSTDTIIKQLIERCGRAVGLSMPGGAI